MNKQNTTEIETQRTNRWLPVVARGEECGGMSEIGEKG